jgi:DNA end-binding protein Ku
MAIRAMWKGILSTPVGEIAVRMYAAAVDRGVHFRLLHRKDLQPVKQEMIHPESGEPVPGDQVRRGAQLDGSFVLLDDDELAKLEPKASREIETVGFAKQSLIPPIYYQRPYRLAPDKGAEKKYAALRDALAAEGAAALVRWVMRKRAYRGVLRPDGEVLTLVTLRSAEEIIDVPRIEAPPAERAGKKELELAEQLVMALAGSFDPSEYHDTYRERVEQLAEQKAKGKKPRLGKPVARRAPRSLERALADSVKKVAHGKAA